MRRLLVIVGLAAVLATMLAVGPVGAAAPTATAARDLSLPSRVNAGRVVIGQTSTFTVTIANRSRTTSHTIVGYGTPAPFYTTVPAVTCTDADAETTSGWTIDPGQSCTWHYEFRPSFRGPDERLLTFSYGGGPTDYVSTLAKGTGLDA